MHLHFVDAQPAPSQLGIGRRVGSTFARLDDVRGPHPQRERLYQIALALIEADYLFLTISRGEKTISQALSGEPD